MNQHVVLIARLSLSCRLIFISFHLFIFFFILSNCTFFAPVNLIAHYYTQTLCTILLITLIISPQLTHFPESCWKKCEKRTKVDSELDKYKRLVALVSCAALTFISIGSLEATHSAREPNEDDRGRS